MTKQEAIEAIKEAYGNSEYTAEIIRALIGLNPSKDVMGTYDICYNCKYYLGGSDWGLFCSHKDMYHHIGKFADAACDYYEKK